MSDPSVTPIIQKILQDGVVTNAEVQTLQKQVDSDWVIDQAEVETLFKVNQAIGENDEDCSDWSQFFVNTVSRLVVMDLFTPGEIDEEEGNWLGGLFDNYSVNNKSEKKLLYEIQNTTTSISGSLSARIKPFE